MRLELSTRYIYFVVVVVVVGSDEHFLFFVIQSLLAVSICQVLGLFQVLESLCYLGRYNHVTLFDVLKEIRSFHHISKARVNGTRNNGKVTAMHGTVP
jgi:hypothetical protein